MKRALGRGLGALLPPAEIEDGGRLRDLAIESLVPNPQQPRRDFAEPAWRDQEPVQEIRRLTLASIAAARGRIYLENQYLTSPVFAEALASRLAEPDGPEVVLMSTEHSPSWFDQLTMDKTRAIFARRLREADIFGRFRAFCPETSGGEVVIVHAKTSVIDDEIVRIGSANLNNRSMGMDTECDVFIDAARPGNAHAQPVIARLRHTLLAEHCGIDAESVPALLERHGSMAAMVEALDMPGKRLAPFVLRPLSDAEKAVADNALLDPERPEELFEPIGEHRGLFRRGSSLRRPKRRR